MKILRINHLGVAPKDPGQSTNFFATLLNLPHEGSEVVAEQKVKVDFLRIGESRVEILTPTEPDSPVAKFIETRGAGIQHMALEVDNLDEWLAWLKERGVKLIDNEPRYGAHNTRIAFVHPHATGGILVELVEEQIHQSDTQK